MAILALTLSEHYIVILLIIRSSSAPKGNIIIIIITIIIITITIITSYHYHHRYYRCEIIEYSNNDKSSFTSNKKNDDTTTTVTSTILVNGHFKDELWGIDVKRSLSGEKEDEFCSVGDDGYLRIWSIPERRQTFSLNMGGMARCCAYSPDGSTIAVGFGGSVGKGKNKEDGMIRIYRKVTDKDGHFVKYEQMTEFQEAKQWISVIKFSPDGSTLAAGSRDNSIYFYSVPQMYKRKTKFSKHNSGINQFDFSACGNYLQSCCSAYEILYFDINNGTQLLKPSSVLIDTEWHTWTCTLGWSVQGIWKMDMDGSDINAVDRSPSKKLIVSADDFGKVKVFTYPSVLDNSSFNAYTGHSSHVTGLRWASFNRLPKDKSTPTDDVLLSLGGNDKCIFQWINSGEDGKTKIITDSGHSNEITTESYDSLLDDAPTGGDEFTAVKPWLGAIVTPSAWNTPDLTKLSQFQAALGEYSSSYGILLSEKVDTKNKDLFKNDPTDKELVKKLADKYSVIEKHAKEVNTKMMESGINNTTAPDADELELEWVHGFRGYDTRNNVFYVEADDKNTKKMFAVYHAAALGICFDLTSRTQKYFRGHTDDIMSMAIYTSSESLPIVATGQQGKCTTFIWEIPSMKLLSSIKTNQKSINFLVFSKCGRLLITMSEDKLIAITDWKSNTVMVNTQGENSVTNHIAVSLAPATTR